MNASIENCTLERADAVTGTLFIPIIQVCLNMAVTAAAVRSRSKLRSNYVYLYVVSMLTANVVFGLFAVYVIANRAFTIEEVKLYVDTTREARNLQRWWVLRNSVLMSMFLVMSANVSSLIYGLRESSNFTGPGAAAVTQRQERSPESTRQRRNRAMAIVAATWLTPSALVIAAVSGWNCLSQCTCNEPLVDWQQLCHKQSGDGCSRNMPPLTTLFLLMIAILWMLLSVGLGVMFWTTVRLFVQVRKPEATEHPQTDDSEISRKDNFQIQSGVNACGNNTNGASVHGETSITCWNSARLNRTIRLMLVTSALFVLCSLPTIILILIDFSSDYRLSGNAVTLSYVSTLLYCIVSPVLLVAYMPRLRQAVVDLAALCKCCTTTVVRSGTGAPTT